MYQTSEAFFEQTKTDTQISYLRGTIEDNIIFTEDHVLSGSFSITAQSTDVSKVTIGTCYTKTLKFVLFHGVTDLRGQWQGKKIKIELGQAINGVIEWVPMGIFYVAEGVWSQKGISITAYDCMSRFDKPLDFEQTSGTAYELLTLACTACDVELGMTEAECEALPNGQDTLGIGERNNLSYYRDFIGALAAALGGFAEIYRDGKLYIRDYHQTQDDTLDDEERFKISTFSDFTSYFSTVTVVNDEDNESASYDTGLENGLDLELGNNAFLQLGTPETVETERQRVADAVANINYTPFSATILTSPYYDLGDVILCSGGIADDYKCCVMGITYSLGKIKLSGYGENPALQKAKSATQKAISGGGKSSRQDLVYHTFVNSDRITLNTNWTKIAQLGFGVTNNTVTEVWHEIIFNLAQGCTVELQYSYDGTVQPYNPKTIFSEDGVHLLGTQYWVHAVGQRVHVWEVFARVSTGTATIAVGDIHILLKGQGLAGVDMWDGMINLTDEFTAFERDIGLPVLEETISLTTARDEHIVLSEAFTAFMHEAVIPTFTEEMNLISFIPHDNLVTEDGDRIVTEDNEQIIT